MLGTGSSSPSSLTYFTKVSDSLPPASKQVLHLLKILPVMLKSWSCNISNFFLNVGPSFIAKNVDCPHKMFSCNASNK